MTETRKAYVVRHKGGTYMGSKKYDYRLGTRNRVATFTNARIFSTQAAAISAVREMGDVVVPCMVTLEEGQ